MLVDVLTLHHGETGNAERLMGAALSSSGISAARLQGASDHELGLDRLRAEAEHMQGDELKPWYWSYRVRVAVK